jgi:hypothetical protein
MLTHGLTNLMVTSLRTENGRSDHPVARVKQEILVNIDTTCQKSALPAGAVNKSTLHLA